jgi:hypothetical protein
MNGSYFRKGIFQARGKEDNLLYCFVYGLLTHYVAALLFFPITCLRIFDSVMVDAYNGFKKALFNFDQVF